VLIEAIMVVTLSSILLHLLEVVEVELGTIQHQTILAIVEVQVVGMVVKM
jgi:hypothetical protein